MRGPVRLPSEIVALTAGGRDATTLQDFLSRRFSLSRRAAKSLIDGRCVWVNRTCVWIAGFKLHAGDRVEVPARVVKAAKEKGRNEPAAPAKAKPKSHVRVLWQNADYLVCDKPAGMVSCDDPKSVEALLRTQESMPDLAAVHRLDRDTTGCLLFAKSPAALDAAIALFKTHRVSKVYHAIVAGRFPYQHQLIDTPIDKEAALSRVTREAASSDASLLRVTIETGRTNQIRRHLASVRFPVVGDRVFGLKSARDLRFMQVPRQMLHASTLELPDPASPREKIRAHSPLPADFRATLRLFGLGKR